MRGLKLRDAVIWAASHMSSSRTEIEAQLDFSLAGVATVELLFFLDKSVLFTNVN